MGFGVYSSRSSITNRWLDSPPGHTAYSLDSPATALSYVARSSRG